MSEDVEEFLDDGRDGVTRKLGAIGEIDLRFRATIRLPPVSESLSDLLDFRPRPKASEGDRDETEDWESRWKCCRLSLITSAHSSVSGIDMSPALADRGWPLDVLEPDTTELEELSKRGLGADLVAEAGGETMDIRDFVFSIRPLLLGGESS